MSFFVLEQGEIRREFETFEEAYEFVEQQVKRNGEPWMLYRVIKGEYWNQEKEDYEEIRR